MLEIEASLLARVPMILMKKRRCVLGFLSRRERGFDGTNCEYIERERVVMYSNLMTV